MTSTTPPGHVSAYTATATESAIALRVKCFNHDGFLVVMGNLATNGGYGVNHTLLIVSAGHGAAVPTVLAPHLPPAVGAAPDYAGTYPVFECRMVGTVRNAVREKVAVGTVTCDAAGEIIAWDLAPGVAVDGLFRAAPALARNVAEAEDRALVALIAGKTSAWKLALWTKDKKAMAQGLTAAGMNKDNISDADNATAFAIAAEKDAFFKTIQRVHWRLGMAAKSPLLTRANEAALAG